MGAPPRFQASKPRPYLHLSHPDFLQFYLPFVSMATREVSTRRRIRTIKRLDICRATADEPKHQHFGVGQPQTASRLSCPTTTRGHNLTTCEMMHAAMVKACRAHHRTKSRPPKSRERSPCRRARTRQGQVWFSLQEQCPWAAAGRLYSSVRSLHPALMLTIFDSPGSRRTAVEDRTTDQARVRLLPRSHMPHRFTIPEVQASPLERP